MDRPSALRRIRRSVPHGPASKDGDVNAPPNAFVANGPTGSSAVDAGRPRPGLAEAFGRAWQASRFGIRDDASVFRATDQGLGRRLHDAVRGCVDSFGFMEREVRTGGAIASTAHLTGAHFEPPDTAPAALPPLVEQ